MRIVCMAVWLINALAAINTGLIPFGFNIFTTRMLTMRFPVLVVPLYYIIGIAGALGLWMFIMAVMGKCNCGKSSCPACGSGLSAGM